jgi:hypothetical protein
VTNPIEYVRDPKTVALLLGDVAVLMGRHQATTGRMMLADGTGTLPLLETEDQLLRLFSENAANGTGSWSLLLAARCAHVWGETQPAVLLLKLAELSATAMDWAQSICDRIKPDLSDVPPNENLRILLRNAGKQ